MIRVSSTECAEITTETQEKTVKMSDTEENQERKKKNVLAHAEQVAEVLRYLDGFHSMVQVFEEHVLDWGSNALRGEDNEYLEEQWALAIHYRGEVREELYAVTSAMHPKFDPNRIESGDDMVKNLTDELKRLNELKQQQLNQSDRGKKRGED